MKPKQQFRERLSQLSGDALITEIESLCREAFHSGMNYWEEHKTVNRDFANYIDKERLMANDFLRSKGII